MQESVINNISQYEIAPSSAGGGSQIDLSGQISCGKEEHVKELKIGARTDNLDQVIAFVDENLEEADCSMKAQMQIDVAVEEIFVNIAQYAYTPAEGEAVIRLDTETVPGAVLITFIDSGIPFNPLAVEEPDVTLSAKDRKVGGLGIFMVKRSMDDVVYEYADNKNILTIKKNI